MANDEERSGSKQAPSASAEPKPPDAVAGLPASIELAWGLREKGTRGPKRGLSLEQIVAAGVKVALTDGLGSVSMGRVAKELGGSTMSLYRYVASKDELLTLMVDAALGPPLRVDRPGEGWRAGLERWALAESAAYQRHPWALRVPISGPPLGPNNVAWLEEALRCMADTALTEQQKLSTVVLISGFVRNTSTLLADIAAANGGAALVNYGTVLARLADAGRFPALQRAIASGALDDEDEEMNNEFDFGLQRILDGVAVLIGAPASAGRRPPMRRRRPR